MMSISRVVIIAIATCTPIGVGRANELRTRLRPNFKSQKTQEYAVTYLFQMRNVHTKVDELIGLPQNFILPSSFAVLQRI